MTNQFFYTRKQVIPPVEGETEVKTKDFLDSFNLEMVKKSMALDDNRRLILLNDIHERTEEVPVIHPKTNKQIGMQKQRITYQSEIYLEVEDSIRFVNLTRVE